MEFSDLGLSPELLQAITAAGYTTPTPIQEKAIPIALQGRDVMGCAQTGTGKTASFALPVIDILAAGRARARLPRALILEPTRELAAQVDDAITVYGQNHKLETALLIGGVSMEEQSKKLDRGADILIATPGRLLDHADRGRVMLRGVKILVIDETDRMLDMGFIPDVQRIVKLLPPLRQTLFFSATLDSQIRNIGAEFVSNPKEVSVAPPSSPAKSIYQSLIRTTQRSKPGALLKLIKHEEIDHAIIFLNRKRDADTVVKSLNRNGYAAAAIHGDLSQSIRSATLENFKSGDVKLLVASDVAARGLDIEALPFVVNYDVPNNPEDYIHRIGRTARAGRKGSAFTLATTDDAKLLSGITALTGRKIPEHDFNSESGQTLIKDQLDKATGERNTKRRRPKRPKSDPSTSPEAQEAPIEAMRTQTTSPKKKITSKKNSPPAKKKEKELATAMGGHVPAFLLRPVPEKAR